MKEPVIFHKEPGKPLEITIIDIPDWEGFDKLIQFVQKYYFAEIIAKYDGPGARKWILQSQGHMFELIHDDGYGNYFIASGDDSEEIVLKIGEDLSARLKQLT